MAGTIVQTPQSPRSARQDTVEPCDVCGAPTYEIRCKVICNRCGYTRDCSDP